MKKDWHDGTSIGQHQKTFHGACTRGSVRRKASRSNGTKEQGSCGVEIRN